MDPRNLGTFLERNTLYCLVGPKDEFEAAVYVDQSDVSFIRPNQPVRLALDIGGGKIVTGTVTQVSQVNLQSVPTELAIDQQLANRADASGVRRPESTTYKTHVKLDPTDVPLLIGARGRAKIEVQWQPLSKRMYRFFLRTFKTVI